MAKRVIKKESAEIGRKLQEAREAAGVRQADMCEPCGLTKNHISAVERGISMASVKMLLGYCRKLSMSPDEVLQVKKEEEKIDPDLKKMLIEMGEDGQRKLKDVLKIIKK